MNISKIFLKSMAAILIMLVMFLVRTSYIKAQNVIFHDNFDDGNANGWTVENNTCFYYDLPAKWEVLDEKYGIIIDCGYCYTVTIPDSISIPPNTDYSFEVDVTLAQSATMDRNFLFKYQDPSNWYGIHLIGNSIHMEKVINGIQHRPPNWTSFYSFQDNQTYHFKVEVMQTELKIYVDDNLITTIPEYPPTFPNSKAGLRASAGAISYSEVWFDNVLVKSLGEKGIDLPFYYEGRPNGTEQQFKSAFWKRLNATFDHVFKIGTFRPFTGKTYSLINCLSGATGITCYDSHNGTDFSKASGKDVFSVAEGKVVFTSEHTKKSCTPNKGGFGCVVIVEYPDNIFGLYAHLNKIYVNEGNNVNTNTILGVMGNTGCPSCGVHLHFGIIKPLAEATTFDVTKMTRGDWKELLYQARPYQTPTPPTPILPSIPTFRAYCTYKAPNGMRFSFQDPSGWKGQDIDPWSKPTSEGGCGIESPYLWKFDVGTSS